MEQMKSLEAETKARIISSATVERLHRMALSFHEQGQAQRAMDLCREMLVLQPVHAGALRLLGACILDSGDAEGGAEFISRALAQRPDLPEAHLDLGRAFLAQGLTEEAARSFARAAECGPTLAGPCQALGLLECDLGRPENALKWFAKAQALAPDEPSVLLHTSWALKSLGRSEEAAATCARAVALAPEDCPARLELAELLIDAGRLAEARQELTAVEQLEPESAWRAFLHGRAALAQNDPAGAAGNFRRCLELDPTDSCGAVAQLVLLGEAATPERAPLAWVRGLYEGQARLWNESMKIPGRGYLGPELLAQALAQALAHTGDGVLGGRAGLTMFDAVLDAGCGSGLCGPLLRPLARRLDGMDFSPAMLKLAKASGMYDRLDEAEVVEHLAGCRAEYDLILAAAVFIYLGELGPVLAAASAALKPGGFLAFTLFPQDGASYDLTATAYYRHGRDHVRSRVAQAGFEVCASLEGVHEYCDDQPVQGLALVLRKPGGVLQP